MAVTISILISVIVGVITWWYMNLMKWNKHISKIPGPSPLPVIGNAHKFGSVTDFLPAAMGFRNEFGDMFIVWLGFRPRLFAADHKFLEFLLGSTIHIEKSYEYRFMHSWLGTGLLTSSSTKWKRQRRLITPTFHFQILEQFVEIFNSQSNVLVEKLRKHVGKKPFDIFPPVALCTLDIICEAAMGTSVNAQNYSDSEYVRSVKEMCRIVMERAYSPIKMWDTLFTLSPDYHIERKSLKVLHDYTNLVIKSRKEQLTSNGTAVDNSDDGTGIKRRLAFLDLLLQCRVDGQPLPDENIREEVDTFMFEGHDTTSSGISFAFYCLAKHPEVQDRIVEELRSIFNDDKDRPPTYTDLQEMKYLEMVIKESMRLYPPVPVFARQLMQDAQYDGGILPKGLAITIFAFGLHRQEDVFPEPERFDPERFSPENTANRSAYAYLPFSAGPRNCIGQRFAMLEMKSTVSKVLRNFEILEVPEHEPILASEAILKSANGLLIRLKEREF